MGFAAPWILLDLLPAGVQMSTCSSCDTALPDDAAFCPSCGIATPTETNRATGEISKPRPTDSTETEHRARLQEAIGSGYELRDLLGRGGFGDVYAAWDVGLQRDVAVKALRHDVFATVAILERFSREARAVAKLRHPHIIPIYTVGEGEGLAYMIMPKIAGENLRTLLEREGQLPVEEVRRILSEAGKALGVAHKAGIVHRDVKPENIILEGDERHVFLMDFGIAKAMETEEDGLTGTGMIVGTPAFMSPEQAGGQHVVDHRSDIYSLGVVGFQMLTGKLPFAADSVGDLIYQQVTNEAPNVRSLRQDVPEWLGSIIERCLSREPDNRWDSVDEFVDGLEQRLPADPKARPPAKGLRLALIGGGLLGVAGLVVMQFGGRDRPTTTTPAAAPLTVVTADSGDTAAVDTTAVTGVLPQSPADPTPAVATQADPPPTQTTTPARTVAAPPVAQVGYLTIDATPFGMVAIDGVDLRVTPVMRHELPVGTYIVTVTAVGYMVWTDTITISLGNEERTRATLRRQP